MTGRGGTRSGNTVDQVQWTDISNLRPEVPLRDMPLPQRISRVARWGLGRAATAAGRRAIRRRVAFTLARSVTPVVAAQIAGERYLVSTHDRAIGATAFSEGEFDLDVMEYALGLIGEHTGRGLRDRTFVDVGANVGTATIPALTRFGAARAVAVEPAPENVKLLRCNLISNGLEDRVVTVNAALSDTIGTGTLEFGPTNWGDHRVRSATADAPARYEESSREVGQVDLVTLDSLVDAGTIDPASVGVVWVDTQGHEGQVLSGGLSVVGAEVPVVIEYWPYGLRRANGLELLHDVVRDHYGMVVDLRASLRRGEVVRLPADAIGRLEEVYSGTSYTDLLLVT